MISRSSYLCQIASEYLQRGWSVIPVRPKSKEPGALGWQNLRLTADDIPRYFNDEQNIGVLLGEPSNGLVDVDLDDPLALQVADRFLPPTGGVFGRASKPRSHWLYVSPEARTTRFEYEGTIVEIRSTGAQTIFPPSIHPSGEPIEWASDGEPAQVDFMTLKRCVGKLAACVLLSRHYPPRGSRQFASMALAGWLLRNGWSQKETSEFLEALCILTGDEELRMRIAQIRNTAQKIEHDLPATGFPRLCEYYDESILHKVAEWLELRTEQHEPPKYLVLDKFYPRPFTQALMARFQFWWPGGREPLHWFDPESGLWREDGEELIVHELRTVVEQLPDVQKRRYVIDEIVADIKGCAWKGKPLPEPQTNLIPLANGVFDVKTGEVRPYRPEDYFTHRLPWGCSPKAQSRLIVPLVESFLPEEQTITLYELMAYCLWRGYPYQKLFLLYGRGSNGKSLFARVLEVLLGKDNVAHVTLGELQHGRFAGAQLYKKLANITGELEYTEIQNTRLLKQLTGEDTIEVDRKYREPVKFRNYAKLVFLTNEIPRSADTTEAFYRRLFLIEFPKQFPENPELEVKVANVEPEEYEALLFKVLQVLQDLRKRNFIFTHHKPVDEVREMYLRLSSPLYTFIEEACEVTYNGGDYIFSFELKERFSQWLQEKGRTAYSNFRLRGEMQALGLTEGLKGERRWSAWCGIRWKTPVTPGGERGERNESSFETDIYPQKNSCKSALVSLGSLTSASHADSGDFVTLGGYRDNEAGVTSRRDKPGQTPEEDDPFVQHIVEIDQTLGPEEARRVLDEYLKRALTPFFEVCDAIARPVREMETFARRLEAYRKRLEKCSVCSHPERREIEAALASGEPLRKVAERFGVGRMALQRHRAKHPPLRTVTIHLSVSRSSVTESGVTNPLSRFEGTVTTRGTVTSRRDNLSVSRSSETEKRDSETPEVDNQDSGTVKDDDWPFGKRGEGDEYVKVLID